jgi:macrophage erythroblast attacher
LNNIPAVPLLNTSLSIGLSALKTPACHSKTGVSVSRLREHLDSMPATNGHTSSSNPAPGRESLIVSLPAASSNGHAFYSSSRDPKPPPKVSAWTTPICPICSTELNELAKDMPNAHHSKSHVDHDPVMLPNGRVYGSEKLFRVNEKLGTEKGMVRDPLDGTLYDASKVKKVYIT